MKKIFFQMHTFGKKGRMMQVLLTDCPYHITQNNKIIKVGSFSCQGCIYFNGIDIWDKQIVECNGDKLKTYELKDRDLFKI